MSTGYRAVTGIRFTWAGEKYRVDLPDVYGTFTLPDGTILTIQEYRGFTPIIDVVTDVEGKGDLPRAEKLG